MDYPSFSRLKKKKKKDQRFIPCPEKFGPQETPETPLKEQDDFPETGAFLHHTHMIASNVRKGSRMVFRLDILPFCACIFISIHLLVYKLIANLPAWLTSLPYALSRPLRLLIH